VCKCRLMMMFACITFNSSLAPLIEGLCSSNPWELEFSGFRRYQTDDLGIKSPSLRPTEPHLHVRSIFYTCMYIYIYAIDKILLLSHDYKTLFLVKLKDHLIQQRRILKANRRSSRSLRWIILAVSAPRWPFLCKDLYQSKMTTSIQYHTTSFPFQ